MGTGALGARRGRHHCHRGAVIPLVVMSLMVLLGFAALTVDVGMLYNTRAELQRTADAAAMAAATELGASAGGDTLARARAAAIQYASLNPVLNSPLALDPIQDVIFGHAYIDPFTDKYVFEPTELFPNAVRVRARRTTSSPSGPVPAWFAWVFGIRSMNAEASASAVLTPRDIVFVLDLSASHHYDSTLAHYRLTEIANRAVWAHLWDTDQIEQPYDGDLPLGPTFGNMTNWGDEVTGPGWDPTSDSGLVRLRRGNDWNLSRQWASQSLRAHGYGTYTSSEMNVINNANGAGRETSHTSSWERENYRRRVRVALGLDRWKSGKPGGQPGGNGDNVIDPHEVVPLVPYPSSSSNPDTHSKEIGGSWDDFIDYVADISESNNVTSNSGLNYRFLRYQPYYGYYGNPELRWRFGLKLLVDYVQDQYPSHNASPGLGGAPQEPMGSVSSAVRESMSIIESLQSSDLVGTAAYGTYGYGPSDKPSHLSWLTDNLSLIRSQVGNMQAGMWSSNTNIAQGIDRGVEVLLDSPRARPNAAKVMILLTDGNANQTRSTPSYYHLSMAYQDTIEAARDAREQGVRIYTVSVGADSDIELMDRVAEIGQGQHFHAEGDVASYRAQLEEIFRALGGRRPVVLIE